jgi:hypothetical protein
VRHKVVAKGQATVSYHKTMKIRLFFRVLHENKAIEAYHHLWDYGCISGLEESKASVS